MVTAAGVAMANRLPVLLLSGDTFQSRLPDPVLQQVEHFGDPSTTVNDAFRPVVRYWDRITRPEQVIQSLPQAIATLLDPADCGPAFLALPQDVQAEAFDFPDRLFEPVVHEVPRPRPDRGQVAAAVARLRGAERPLVVAGGGVHYSLRRSRAGGVRRAPRHPGRRDGRRQVDARRRPPVLRRPDRRHRVSRRQRARRRRRRRARRRAPASATSPPARGPCSATTCAVVGVNAARFDAGKHLALPVVGDAREALAELDAALGDWAAPAAWTARVATEVRRRCGRYLDRSPRRRRAAPTYAQVVGALSTTLATPDDYALTASGGFPGELNNGWRSPAVATFDCEYGFSCMGYEISGAWGAAMARRPAPAESIVFVGDGSYLMLNSDLYSSVLSGHTMIVVVCDNGGFAVIDRLQVNQGGASFNNLLATARPRRRAGAGRLRRPRRVDGCEYATRRHDRRARDARSRGRAGATGRR